MAQQLPTNFPIDPFTTSGIELASILNELQDAYKSTQSGTSRPDYAVQGFQWLDITGTKNIAKMYTGSVDLWLLEYDTVAGKAIINGGSGFTDKSKSIVNKSSIVTTEEPVNTDLIAGEIAINRADKKLFFLDDSGNTASVETGALLDSPAFTGTPTAPTPLTSENSTRLATTAYTKTNLALKATLNSSETASGGFKSRVTGSSLYLTNTGTNP